MIFTIKSKGTNNDGWAEHEIEADNLKDAQKQADTIYGVLRDEDGEQTNSELITVEVIERVAKA